MENLKWRKDNERHFTGFEDGAAWGWVYLGDDDTWWWETDCTDDGTTQYTSGFTTAEEAQKSAEAAYAEWLEDFGDPLAIDEPIELPTAVIGTLCDIYGYCPYGCEIGDSRCISCAVFTEMDLSDCED